MTYLLTKVGVATYIQKQSFLVGYQTTPQLPDYEEIKGSGSITFLYLFHSYVYQIIVVIKWDYSGTHFIFMDLRKIWIKHGKRKIYFKSKNMNSPWTITHSTHSINHVMDIVILTCRTFLFFHHLWINWIVGTRARKQGWNLECAMTLTAISISGTFWSQVDINLIREVPLTFCLLQTIKQHNWVCVALFNCSTRTQIQN